MKTNVKTTGIELTKALSLNIDEKIKQVAKFLDPKDESVLFDVEVGIRTKRHQSGSIFRAEINLHTAGNDFRVESEKEDLYIAINDAKEQLIEVVNSQKTKRRTLVRKGAGAIKNILKFGK